MKFQSLSKALPIALLAFFTLASGNAQTDPPARKGRPSAAKPVRSDEARAEEDVTKDLNLTKEQKAEFKKADEAYKTKSKAMKNGRKEDQQSLREERMRAHKAVLSQDQQKKYDEAMAKRDARHKEKQALKSHKKAEKSKVKKTRKAERAPKTEKAVQQVPDRQ